MRNGARPTATAKRFVALEHDAALAPSGWSSWHGTAALPRGMV